MRKPIPLLLLPLLLPTFALSDQILLHNGKTLTGDITAEDAHTLTLRTADSGSSLTLSRKLSKSTIKQIIRPRREGPAYATLPVHGVIGQDVTANSLKAGLAAAARANVQYILLDIDSPGGNLGHLDAMLQAVTDAADDRPVVAYVRNAYSAAAILAMSCKQIYMAPKAAIGAAVPYRPTPNGPAAVEAKMLSAVAAHQRAYVTAAGHDPLLLRGMMELDTPLYLLIKDNQPTLSVEGPGKLIKPKGSILTLTAAEAAECGLASIATDLPDVGKQLTAGPWHEPTRDPWNTVQSTAAADQRKGPTTPDGRPTPANTALARIKADYDALGRQITELTQKSLANAKSAQDLKRKAEADLATIRADYESAIARAKTHADTAKAKDTRDTRLNSLRQSYEPQIKQLAATQDTLREKVATLRAQQQSLLATLPTD